MNDKAATIRGRSSAGAVGGALRILMLRYDVGVDDAFELLLRGARRAGLDLRDMATGVVHASRRMRRGGPVSCRLERGGLRPITPAPRSSPRR